VSIVFHADESLRDTLRAAVIYFLNNGADGFMANPRSFEFRFRCTPRKVCWRASGAKRCLALTG
jgi:hypothetical protein